MILKIINKKYLLMEIMYIKYCYRSHGRYSKVTYDSLWSSAEVTQEAFIQKASEI